VTPEELYKSSLRLRLTRAGLLKIMRENEARDAVRITKVDAVADSVDNHADAG
jgi:hypothetical protein